MGWEFVEELINILKPEPLSRQEEIAAQSISDTDFTIYSEKLNMICEEAKEAFVRSGVTTMLLSGDLVVGLYSAAGDLVTALCGTYIHAVSGGPPIKYILRRWKDVPTVGIKEGDFFFFNDPLFGALHSPDEGLVMPIFYEDRLIAWAGAAVQQTEIGAKEPGMANSARSRYDEGLKMPPVKIGENYQLREDLVEAMANMTRTVQMHIIDTRARATACDRVRVRIQELCRKKEASFVVSLFQRMILETERGAREKISRWNDGCYTSVAFCDSIGYREGLVKVTVTVKKKGDRILMDFSEGTSPENDGSRNSFGHMAVAHAIKVLYEMVFSDLPPSAGIFGPHEFKFLRGSVLHASDSASTILSPPSLAIVMQVVHSAYAKMMFASEEDRSLVTAPLCGVPPGYIYGGTNQWGNFVADVVTTVLNTAAAGGKSGADGDNSFCFAWCPWGKAADIEDLENEVPWLHIYYSHLKGSGGFGKHRGGAATSIGLVQYHTPYIGFSSQAYSSRTLTSSGLFGGYPASALPGIIVRNSDVIDRLQGGENDLPRDTIELITERSIAGQYEISQNCRPMQAINRGDIYVIHSGGAGGYGDVLERHPKEVMKDLREGLISHWTARNVYRVAYDEEALEVNYQLTEALRQEEREDRKERGKPYSEFTSEWSAQPPPPGDALDFYGSWPDGKPVKTVIRL